MVVQVPEASTAGLLSEEPRMGYRDTHKARPVAARKYTRRQSSQPQDRVVALVLLDLMNMVSDRRLWVVVNPALEPWVFR